MTLTLAASGCQGNAVVGGGIDAGSPSEDGASAGWMPDCGQDAGPAGDGAAPVSTLAAVTKVKTLLVGLPLTDAEAQAVETDPSALFGLVGQWMALPQYNNKMLQFFITAFQQDQFTYDQLVFQFVQYHLFERDQAWFLQNLQQSFARTAMELIAEGQPFTTTMTTTRYMMTPAMMTAYAILDVISVDDNYNRQDLFQRDHPTRVTLQSARRIPIESAIDPASPDFMTFYDPSIASSGNPGCPVGTLVYPSPASYQAIADFLFNQQHWAGMGMPGMGMGMMRCMAPPIAPADRYTNPADFTTWHMVTVRPPRPGEDTTRFYDLPGFRAGHDLVANIPRVGFFTTPAFFARWPTNDSNVARVLINQTTIVALGESINLHTATPARDLSAVDSHHAMPGTECYGCHQSLDPMRQIFRQAFSLYGSVQVNPTEVALSGQFAFDGVTASGTRMADLGAQLASHPRFAPAWVQRLCTYANSAPCDETDPEFVRLVGVFTDSHYSWNALVQALFASPIVTYLHPTRTSATAGQIFPIARQAHLCATLSSRLGVPDLCGLDVATVGVSPVLHTIAQSWPSDQYSRGNPTPSLAVAPSLLMRGGMESLCADLAQRFVDNGPMPLFSSADPLTAIRGLTTQLMGLTRARADGPQAILQDHFTAARQSGASPTDALRSTFTLACLSPYVAGVGQ